MMTFGAGVPKSGMMEIGIALVLHDRFSNQAAQASKEIRRLQQDAKMAVQNNLNQAYQFGTMGLNAFRTIASGVSEMISYGAQFVDTMVTVEAITEATESSMGRLKDIAMSLGATTMFSSQDVASGMKYLAMAGNTAEQIQAMIKGATYAAGATGMALGGKGGAADVITNVMRTFQLSGEKAALQVGDIMTNATLSSNISMQDLAASVRYAAADMTNLGYKLPEVSAAIGTLGNMGIQGSMAGTALANMARYLNRSISDPSYKGHKFLEKIGLTKKDLVDSTGQLKDLYSIMSMIKNATAGMDATDRNLVTTSIFGVRGNRAAVALMRDLDNFRKLYEDVAGTTPGFAQRVVEQRMGTVAGQLNAMRSTWENVKASFTEAASGVLIPIFKSLTGFFQATQKFLSTGVGKFLAGAGLVSTALFGISTVLLIIRSRFLMLKTDSTVSARNMFAVLTTGWQSAKLAAADYAHMEQLILNQRAAGIGAKAGAIALASGYPVKGVKVVNTGKSGKRFYDTATRKFVSAKSATVAGAIGAGAAATTAGVMGKTAVGLGSKLLGFGSKLLGFLGGPWGLAIMALTTIVPMVIGAIHNRRQAQKENSVAIADNTAAVKTLSGQLTKNAEEQAKKDPAQREKELIGVANALIEILRKDPKSKNINLNITNNGKPVVNVVSEEDEDVMMDLSL